MQKEYIETHVSIFKIIKLIIESKHYNLSKIDIQSIL